MAEKRIIRGAMETWYKVELSEGDVNQRKNVALFDAFKVLFLVNGAPADAAMFSKVDEQPPYVYFFTPGSFKFAEGLLHRYGATECPKPMVHQVSLEAGNSDAIKLFFFDSKS